MAEKVGVDPRQLRRVAVASAIGTTIEWYDFFIYGTAAGLVLGKLYFPNEAPLAGTLAAFAAYFIGFIGRPIGAAIFGHYGDRIGRKATLIATLLCMGIATFPEDGQTTRTLLLAADQAEHTAKRLGKNRVVAAGMEPPVRNLTGV